MGSPIARGFILLICVPLAACFRAGGSSTTVDHGRLFVTSQSFAGNLGGLDGADSRCQLAADGAGLGGTWKAWLSTNVVSASGRLTLRYPLERLDGIVVFDSENDRLIGLPRNPPDVDEHLNVVGNLDVWTNTDTVGASLTQDCNAWTSSSAALNGRAGSSQDSSVNRWTTASSPTCANSLRLYCLEQ